MGCAPFGRMISMACERMGGGAEGLKKGRKKKKKKRISSQHQYDGMAPATTTPITSHHGLEPTIKSVIYSNDGHAVVMHPQDTVFTPSSHATMSVMDSGRRDDQEPKATRVRFALPEGHKAAGKSMLRAHDQNQHPEEKVGPGEPVVVVGGGGGGSTFLRYMPSPLPGREHYDGGGTGEYLHYPTPVREGIYRLATGNNQFTTMFSEENPNACSIA